MSRERRSRNAPTAIPAPDLHPAQRAIYDSPARFRVVAAGRRFGKTLLGAWLCVETAQRGGRTWWVAPHYPIAAIGWRMIKRMLRRIPDITIREGERSVEFPGDGWIQVKSASRPDDLRGEGLDLVVIDEAAFVLEEAWTEALRPALTDRKGRAVFISTPNGLNWFFRLYQRGLEPDQVEWAAFQAPTSANPHIDAAEIASARELLPERLFRAEYLAEFLDEQDSVFRGVAECATLAQADPRPGARYVIGVDLARSQDFTVISVIDADRREQVYVERFNRLGWSLQIGRIKAVADRYQAEAIIVDQTGVGDAVIEQLRREIGEG